MNRTGLRPMLAASGLLAIGALHAQGIEAVYVLDFASTDVASAAMTSLFEDSALQGGKATLSDALQDDRRAGCG